MKETGLTGKRGPTTIAATPDDGNSQRKRRGGRDGLREGLREGVREGGSDGVREGWRERGMK